MDLNLRMRIDNLMTRILLTISLVLTSSIIINAETSPTQSLYDLSVTNNNENKFLDYKISNYNDVYVYTKDHSTCYLTPESMKEGGRKDCESVFEIENRNEVKPTINNPNRFTKFSNQNFENLVYEFSNTYNLVTENYTEYYFNGSEDVENVTPIERREFNNFVAMPSDIDTSEPFAVKVKFDVPTYSTNQFNFTFSKGGFVANIDPTIGACGEISSPGIYNLTTDITNVVDGTECFEISASDVVLDGQGYLINGTVLWGVYIPGSTNVTIKNFRGINNFATGVQFSDASFNTVHNNTISNWTSNAIDMSATNTNNNNISNNTMWGSSTSDDAIDITTNSNNHIIENNWCWTGGSSQHCVSDDTINNNTYRYNYFNVSGTNANGIEFQRNSNTSDSLVTGNFFESWGSNGGGMVITNTDNVTVFNNEFLVSGSSNGITQASNTFSTNISYNVFTGIGANGHLIEINGIGRDLFIYRNNFTAATNQNAVDVLGDDLQYSRIIENYIERPPGASFSEDIYIDDNSYNNTIEGNKHNHSSTANSCNMLTLADQSRQNTIRNNDYVQLFDTRTIILSGNPRDNWFINNNFTRHQSGTFDIFFDSTTDNELNYLVYNNSFGEIKWSDAGSGGFLRDFDLGGENLSLNKYGVFITNRTAYVNLTAFNAHTVADKMNSSVNITMRGLNLTSVTGIRYLHNPEDEWTVILADGSLCTSSFCTQISYTGNTLIFNSTQVGSFTPTSEDAEFPSVSNLKPVPDTLTVEAGVDVFEIGATMTDNAAISNASAFVAIPGEGSVTLTLSNSAGNTSFYNISYQTPTNLGKLNITLYAFDGTNANQTEKTNVTVTDTIKPNATDLFPAGINFPNDNKIEIGFNATDIVGLDNVTATLTIPDGVGTTVLLHLTNSTEEPSKFNISYDVGSIEGRYNITFFVNDTSGNINNSESTFFNAKAFNCYYRRIGNATNSKIVWTVDCNGKPETNDWSNVTINANQLYFNSTVFKEEDGGLFGIVYTYFSSTFIELTDLFGGDVSGTYDDLTVTDNSHLHAANNITNGTFTGNKYTFDNNVTVKKHVDVLGNFTGNQIYGEMWFHNDTATGVVTEILATDQWENVSGFNQLTEANQTLNGFVYNSASNGSISPLVDGMYDCSYDISFGNTGNNQEYQISLFVNEAMEDNTDGHRKIGAAGDVGNSGERGFIRMVANDVLTLRIKNVDSTDNVLVHSAGVNCVRIGT